MLIGIDIDGTLYPWTEAVNAAVMEQFGCSDPGPHITWNHLYDFLGGDDRWRWVWSDAAAKSVFGRLDKIYPGAAEAVNNLAENHEVHFVTHRNPAVLTATTGRWLAHFFSDYKGVHVLKNTVAKKDLLDWDVFIDDKTDTVDDLAAAHIDTHGARS